MQRNNLFGKDVTRYIRGYKAEMLRCGISEELQVLSFNCIAIEGLRWSIHEIREQNPTWVAFEEALKSAYSIQDTSKAMRRGFKD